MQTFTALLHENSGLKFIHPLVEATEAFPLFTSTSQKTGQVAANKTLCF